MTRDVIRITATSNPMIQVPAVMAIDSKRFNQIRSTHHSCSNLSLLPYRNYIRANSKKFNENGSTGVLPLMSPLLNHRVYT